MCYLREKSAGNIDVLFLGGGDNFSFYYCIQAQYSKFMDRDYFKLFLFLIS